MTALLRQPHRVPTLFCLPAACEEWTGRKLPGRAPEQRFESWPALFDRKLAFETTAVPRRSQAFVAISVLLLLYAVPFLRIGDAILDVTVPR